jgi:hypothetical protein
MSTDTARTPKAQAVRAARSSVRVTVWGASDKDRRMAEHDARTDQRVARYRVQEVIQVDDPSAASGDLVALARGAEYDRTWAAYLLPDGPAGGNTA